MGTSMLRDVPFAALQISLWEYMKLKALGMSPSISHRFPVGLPFYKNMAACFDDTIFSSVKMQGIIIRLRAAQLLYQG